MPRWPPLLACCLLRSLGHLNRNVHNVGRGSCSGSFGYSEGTVAPRWTDPGFCFSKQSLSLLARFSKSDTCANCLLFNNYSHPDGCSTAKHREPICLFTIDENNFYCAKMVNDNIYFQPVYNYNHLRAGVCDQCEALPLGVELHKYHIKTQMSLISYVMPCSPMTSPFQLALPDHTWPFRLSTLIFLLISSQIPATCRLSLPVLSYWWRSAAARDN